MEYRKESTCSYPQIVKSFSVISGAKALNSIVGFVRTKLVTVLLGQSGVGMIRRSYPIFSDAKSR